MTEKIFLTSDTHFWHRKIMLPEYCNRPFSSVEEMNETMIKNWNNVVSKDDLVYHLGDFAFCGSGKITEIMQQLKGRIILIKGNHDFDKKEKYQRLGFFDVLSYHIIDDIFLSHYPMYTEKDLMTNLYKRNEEDVSHTKQCYEKISKVFFASGLKKVAMGHIHQHWYTGQEGNGIFHFNCGVDRWDFTPVSLDFIKNYFNHF